MLQEYWRDGHPAGAPGGPPGQGVSICFFCEDAVAIYRDLVSRGVPAARPFVGNGLWVCLAVAWSASRAARWVETRGDAVTGIQRGSGALLLGLGLYLALDRR